MHSGVHGLVNWIGQHPDFEGVQVGGPATAAQLTEVEDRLASPLPADLRMVLQRYNGGSLPSGELLVAGGGGEGSILGVLIELATQLGRSPHDPEVLLPFFRNDDGGILAFDRTAGPVADTWPVVDFYPESGDLRLVHRTFDGWCRLCVAEWTAPDFEAPFTLSKYLESGQRHVQMEPDVSVAHATVAHALRRAGRPEEALHNYLEGARCLPSQPWCDWEALKLSVLLSDLKSALEAASRLSSRAPEGRWAERETSPELVAQVLGAVAADVVPREAVMRLFDQLAAQSRSDEGKALIAGFRRALNAGEAMPAPNPVRPLAVQPAADAERFYADLTAAYEEGRVRDDDLILEPQYQALRSARGFAAILRTPREF